MKHFISGTYQSYQYLVQAMACLIEALYYKPDGRRMSQTVVKLEFSIDVMLPAA